MKAPSIDHLFLRLQSAFELVRCGDLLKGRQVLLDIRGAVAVAEFPELAIDVIFLEAVIAAYLGDWIEARNRILRSITISIGRSDTQRKLRGLAWMSFIQFNSDQLFESLDSAARVLSDPELKDHQTKFRASVVIGSLMQYANLVVGADRWFSLARQSAELATDTSLVSMAMFNSVVTRVASERFNRRLGVEANYDLDLTLLFAKSVESLDRYGGLHLNPSFHSLVQAQIQVLRRNYVGALELLNRLEHDNDVASDNMALVKFEALFCDLMMNPKSVELRRVEMAEELLPNLSGDDENAIACRVLSEAFDALGLTDKKLSYLVKSNEFSARFLELRSDLASRLRFLVSPLDDMRT